MEESKSLYELESGIIILEDVTGCDSHVNVLYKQDHTSGHKNKI